MADSIIIIGLLEQDGLINYVQHYKIKQHMAAMNKNVYNHRIL